MQKSNNNNNKQNPNEAIDTAIGNALSKDVDNIVDIDYEINDELKNSLFIRKGLKRIIFVEAIIKFCNIIDILIGTKKEDDSFLELFYNICRILARVGGGNKALGKTMEFFINNNETDDTHVNILKYMYLQLQTHIGTTCQNAQEAIRNTYHLNYQINDDQIAAICDRAGFSIIDFLKDKYKYSINEIYGTVITVSNINYVGENQIFRKWCKGNLFNSQNLVDEAKPNKGFITVAGTVTIGTIEVVIDDGMPIFSEVWMHIADYNDIYKIKMDSKITDKLIFVSFIGMIYMHLDIIVRSNGRVTHYVNSKLNALIKYYCTDNFPIIKELIKEFKDLTIENFIEKYGKFIKSEKGNSGVIKSLTINKEASERLIGLFK